MDGRCRCAARFARFGDGRKRMRLCLIVPEVETDPIEAHGEQVMNN